MTLHTTSTNVTASVLIPDYRYRCTLIRVLDGDTVEVDVDLGFYTRIRTKLRLFGINCPETNTPEGKAAKAYLVNLISGRGLIARVYKADKYGNRWDADLFFQERGPDDNPVWINQNLVENGHAVQVTY